MTNTDIARLQILVAALKKPKHEPLRQLVTQLIAYTQELKDDAEEAWMEVDDLAEWVEPGNFGAG